MQKRTEFNLTFVKWAAEIAHFQSINKDKTIDEASLFNFNLHPEENRSDFIAFEFYIQSLGHRIAKTFKDEIFANGTQMIDAVVVRQIMLLTFSFALRVQLSVIFRSYFLYNGVVVWQLKTLLSAYKNLSAHNTNVNENTNNGIFPFKIIQISQTGNHFWAQLLCPEQKLSDYNSEQKHYVDNFKFILRLSEFTLSQYEIGQVLEAITKEKTEIPMESVKSPAIYSFVKKHLADLLKSSSLLPQWLSKNYWGELSKMDCAMINFGHKLQEELLFNQDHYWHHAFSNAKCYDEYIRPSQVVANITPSKDSLYSQLGVKLFNEPLWNYSQVIGIDQDNCKTILQYGNFLIGIIRAALKKPNENKETIENLTSKYQFKIFISSFDFSDYVFGKEISKQLKTFEKKYFPQSFSTKIDSLNELLGILDQINTIYNSDKTRVLCTQLAKLQNNKNGQTYVHKFGQILYESLTMNANSNVKYDQKHQLLTFPVSMGKHIIRRLSAFVESPMLDELDFVKTIQTVVASADKALVAEKIKFEGEFFYYSNGKMLYWLFFLATRLCTQIDNDDDDDYDAINHKYLPKIVSALGRIYDKYVDLFSEREAPYNFDQYKVNIVNQLVQISLPNWNLPYFVYLANENDKNELIEEKPIKWKKISGFLVKLSKYSPTIYEVIKMTQILYEMDDDDEHILVRQSDPKIFKFIINFLNDTKSEFNAETKVSTKGNFCILAHFVMDLLTKANEAEYLPNIDIVKVFMNQAKDKCTPERVKAETIHLFWREHVDFGKTLQLNLKYFYYETEKFVLPALIAELDKMLQKGDWHYANLSDVKKVEWQMLELALCKSGQSQKWDEIEILWDSWKKSFAQSFQSPDEMTIKKLMEEIKEKLENLSEAKKSKTQSKTGKEVI